MDRSFFNDSRTKRAALISTNRACNQLAIFVHGYHGSYLGTWGKLPQALELEAAEPFSRWDYLFLGFNTKQLSCYSDIADLLRTQINLATNGTLFAPVRYERFALIAHSLGSLGVRQLICDYPSHGGELLGKLHSVLFFGCPTNGSDLAGIGRRFLRDKIADWLRPGAGQLCMLHGWTATYHAHVHTWPRVEAVYGIADRVVGAKYRSLVEWAGDQPPELSNAGHSKMKEPADWPVDEVKSFIQRALL